MNRLTQGITSSEQGLVATTRPLAAGFAASLPDLNWLKDIVTLQETVTGIADQYQGLLNQVMPPGLLSQIATPSWFGSDAMIGQGLLAQQAAGLSASILDAYLPANTMMRELGQLVGPGIAAGWLPDVSALIAQSTPSWLPSATMYQTRFATLAEGLRDPTAAGYGFGALQGTLDRSPRVRDALDETIEVVSRPGAFGLNYDEVGDATERLDAALEHEPETVELLQQPLREAHNEARLERHDVVELGTLTGIWERARQHQLTSTGLIIGWTAGLLQYGVNLAFAETNPTASVAAGAAVYMWIANNRGTPSPPR